MSPKMIHQLGIDVKPAYVLPTNDFFKGANASGKPVRSSFSTHLKYGFKFGPDTDFGKTYPYAIQGIGISYNTFSNTSEIGNPIAAYVFQTSRIASLARDLSLDYEWNFGASFGWKKYDEVTNPMNLVVGSRINAYLHLGFLLNWQLTPNLSFRTGVGITHYSNGNTRYPNSGVNTVGGHLGIAWQFGRSPQKPTYLKQGFDPYVSYDLILYGATRKRGVALPDGSALMVSGSFAVGGLNLNPMYNFNPYFKAGLSLDAQYDESANLASHIANTYTPSSPDEIKFHRPPFREQFSLGLSVRAEIVMPIFSINIGIGKNFLCSGADTNDFYQILALKTHITKNFFLHVGYQLYRFKDPNNLMLGLGYSFRTGR